ncbi:MAG: hypothetical protein OEQ53_09690, partial [Saprospiraceae bacterium]|nr:hypothetical protein [Saprospiraceae bacterium]
PPQCNIICFRFRPSKIDQLKLREKLIRTGLYYITTTEINGDRYLRLVVMNQETDRNVISGMLDQIEILADQISQ